MSYRSTAERRARPGARPPLRALLARGLLAALGAGVLASCDTSGGEQAVRETARAIAVIDPTGRDVTLDAPARRVISMMPAVTEWVIAMGAADRLVARTDFDHHPSIDALPSVGRGLTPSVEWLAARRPDLVVAWPDAPSRSLVARLEQTGIAVYTAPVESIADALYVAEDLGTLLGEQPAAERVIAGVRAGLDSVRASVEGRERPRVLYLIGLDPLMAAGPGTFVDELLEAAGARNVLHDLGIRWPQLSLEEVVRRAPEIIIVGSVRVGDPAALLADRPGWREVPAVQRGAVYPVDPDAMNRSGPGMAAAAARLAELIHGAAGAS